MARATRAKARRACRFAGRNLRNSFSLAGTDAKVTAFRPAMATPARRATYSGAETPATTRSRIPVGLAQRTPQSLGRVEIPHGALRDANGNCCCFHCCAASRRGLAWRPASPYLEDLTKRLVTAPPARRKLQLVPAARRTTDKATASPYEPCLPHPSSRRHPFRGVHMSGLTVRELRDHWYRDGLLEHDADAAAAAMGVDTTTYVTLLSMQHRDITPEDYDVLKGLDESLQKKTMTQEEIDARLPSFAVADSADDADAPTPSGSDGGAPAPAAALQQCTICLERFEPGQRARRLPCAHVFHAECVDRWLTGSSCVCPGCGKGVKPEPNTAAGAKQPEVVEEGDEGCAPVDEEAGH